MLTAITRAVSPALADCELSFIERLPIDMERAREQHHAYEKALASLGANLISLPPEPELPDSMFVEDSSTNLRSFFRSGRKRGGGKLLRLQKRFRVLENSNTSLCLEPSKAATFCESAGSFLLVLRRARMKKEFVGCERSFSRTVMK
jgi:hypothetical protein